MRSLLCLVFALTGFLMPTTALAQDDGEEPSPPQPIPGGVGMPTRLYECDWGNLIIEPPITDPPMGSPDDSMGTSVVVSPDDDSAEGPIVGTAVAADTGPRLDTLPTNTPIPPRNPDQPRHDAVLTIRANDDLARAEDPCQAVEDFLRSDPTSDLAVEDVQAMVMESYPPQVALLVKGYAPDGCVLPRRILRAKDGSTFIVKIWREVDRGIACPTVITPFEERVWLGTVEPDDYVISINDFRLELAL